MADFAAPISHRGPDAGDVHVRDGVGLAHWRLSILDLTSGDQPMTAADGDVVVIFNGQIYNYREVRASLEGHGHGFRTTSDTEVLLKAYLEWGADCAPRLWGMWAFAIADYRGERPRLFCSRDRMGIKPFYYTKGRHRLAFASELKAFTGLSNFETRLDERTLNDYLVFGPKYGGNTLLRGVTELSPGHSLEISEAGSLSVTRYFSLAETFEEKREASAEEIGHIVRDAVGRRLNADVPVATINSGGLDSSLISAIAIQEIPQLTTFSVAPTPRDDGQLRAGDESREAQLLANWIGSRHHTVRYDDDDLLARAGETTDFNDGEVFHSNSLPMSRLFQVIRQAGFKVVLGGEGADEVFRGYYSERLLRLTGPLGPGLLDRVLSARGRSVNHVRSFAAGTVGLIANLRQSRFSPELSQEITGRAFELLPERGDLFAVMETLPPANALAFYEQSAYLAGLLRRADRMSMMHGVELRVPYLDHRLVVLLNAIPASRKSGHLLRHEKRLLKRIAGPLVPPDILARRKYGFATPISSMTAPLRERLAGVWGRGVAERLNAHQAWTLLTSVPSWC